MNNSNKKDFIRASLGLATAQICHGLGWHSVHRSSHDILTDLLERYIKEVSKTAVNISQTCCRTIPNLDDVALTFDHLGIHLHELQDYVQQVEAAPAQNHLVPLPVKAEHNLLDFSGADYLPALINITPKVEIEHVEREVNEEPTEDVDEVHPTNEERPNSLSLRVDAMDSPPYSPLEPKSLNVGALTNLDLTRPDLKVAAPKGYTPITTSPPPVTTAVAITTVAKTTPTTATVATTSSTQQVTFTTPKNEPTSSKAVKSSKKEKKESKKSSSDKKESSQKSLLSPPVALGSDKVNSPGSNTSSKTKKSKEKTFTPSPILDKKDNQSASSASKKLTPSPISTPTPPILTPTPTPTPTALANPSPYLHGSPDSSLFSPPRKKLAMYQSDKKKTSKEKSSKESKSSKSEKSSPTLGGSGSKENKSEKSSKPKSSLNSPLSSLGFSSPHKILSPPAVKRELSPPHLSPLVKKDSSGAPKRTVIFPPSNKSPTSDANPAQPSKHDNENAKKEKRGRDYDSPPPPRVKEETGEIDGTPPALTITPLSVSSEREIKKEPTETLAVDEAKKKVVVAADSSEHEVDVLSLSQDESSYTDTFKPNMFFPTFGEEKKKKKKKKSDKQRDEKGKKNDGTKEKKEKKKKREEPSSSTSSSAIPRLTLKMGTETISDAPSKLFSIPRGPCSPSNKFSTAMSAAALPPPPPVKKKKSKHKQKDKDRDRERDGDEDYKGGFYAETIKSSAPDVYYCPGCKKPDDGSPMIGCDSCDDWYHWPCVDIIEEPDEDEKWFCPNCPNGMPAVKKKKKKKKRDDF